MTFTCKQCGDAFEGSTHWSAKNEYCSKNCVKRASHNARRPHCGCGALISMDAKQCWECRLAEKEAQRLVRREAIRELWGAGKSPEEIIQDERVGLGTVGALHNEIVQMRGTGWDVPHRKKNWRGFAKKPGRPSPSTDLTKDAVRQRLRYALYTGRIERPSKCEGCGEKKRVQAHHADYSKPLEVQWLCPSCHMNQHWDEWKAAA